MARPRDLNFSSDIYSGRIRSREGVYIREPSSDIIDVDNDLKSEVNQVVAPTRDKKNLSLALRKLHCCSQCFSQNSHMCQCSKNVDRHNSTVSVISGASLNSCYKCQNCKVCVLFISSLLF